MEGRTLRLLGAFAVTMALAVRAAAAPAMDGASLLRDAAAAFFNETATHDEVRLMLRESRESFRLLADEAARLYWLARADYLGGIVERADNAPRAAEALFTASLTSLLRSVGIRETSEAYRLIADDYAQLMFVNGILYTITTGRNIKIYAEKALAIDPSNPKARLTLALYALHAPRFAGGNEQQAVDLLRELRARGDLEPEDRFAVSVWLSIASERRKDRAGARASLAEARGVYPNSSWISELSKKMEEGS